MLDPQLVRMFGEVIKPLGQGAKLVNLGKPLRIIFPAVSSAALGFVIRLRCEDPSL